MNTIKTALVTVVLLGVFYGVWVMLNKSPLPMPAEVIGQQQWAMPPAVDLGSPGGNDPLGQVGATDSTALMPPAAEAPPFSASAAPSAAPPWNSLGGSSGGPPSAATPPPTDPAAPNYPSTPSTPSRFSATETAPTSGVGQTGYTNPNSDLLSSAGVTAEPYRQSPPDYLRNTAAGSPSTGGYAGSSGQPSSTTSVAFTSAWTSAQAQLERQQLATALDTLSIFFDNPDLSPDQRKQLVTLLDQLAGTVIYSREYRMEPHYVVRRGDTLEEIAKGYNVPWQLLAYINGIDEKEKVLVPGNELKVVRGPFSAVVNLSEQKLTLKLHGNYAGQFPIGPIKGQPPQQGEYEVREKMPPGDAANPYGEYWLGLGGNLRIQGETSSAYGPARDAEGVISVSPRDARDLYAILSTGSRVMIQR